MTTDDATLGVPRWIRLALPDDVEQEIAVVGLEHPDLTTAARRELVRYRLAVLRHEVWDRRPTRVPRSPAGIRPSKLNKRRGYRRNKGVRTQG